MKESTTDKLMDAKSNPNMDIFGKGREVKAKYDLRKM
jgi:hypothetical protein